MAFLQFMNCFDNFRLIHLMHFHAVSDVREQGDRQFAAEMFAKFLEAGEDLQTAVCVDTQQFIGKQLEAQFFQQIQNASSGLFVEQSDVTRIKHVERDADGDGLAMGNLKTESCSSLCAAQCPKSSGRAEPISNGSPLVAMWSRCSSAQRRMRCFIAAGSNATSFSAARSSSLKNPARGCRRP